jgi:hypothetical protein
MVSKSADPLTRDRGFESGSLQRRVVRTPVQTSKLRASWGWARLKLPLPFRRLSTKKKGRRDPKREIHGLRRVPAENLGDEEDGEGFRPPAARVQLRYRFPTSPAIVNEAGAADRDTGGMPRESARLRRSPSSGDGLEAGK